MSDKPVDTEELMRLHAATATPALEQLCWYDVKPEQADFFEACLEDVPRLVADVAELVKAATAMQLLIAREMHAGEAYGYAHIRETEPEIGQLDAALKRFEGK